MFSISFVPKSQMIRLYYMGNNFVDIDPEDLLLAYKNSKLFNLPLSECINLPKKNFLVCFALDNSVINPTVIKKTIHQRKSLHRRTKLSLKKKCNDLPNDL